LTFFVGRPEKAEEPAKDTHAATEQAPAGGAAETAAPEAEELNRWSEGCGQENASEGPPVPAQTVAVTVSSPPDLAKAIDRGTAVIDANVAAGKMDPVQAEAGYSALEQYRPKIGTDEESAATVEVAQMIGLFIMAPVPPRPPVEEGPSEKTPVKKAVRKTGTKTVAKKTAVKKTPAKKTSSKTGKKTAAAKSYAASIRIGKQTLAASELAREIKRGAATIDADLAVGRTDAVQAEADFNVLKAYKSKIGTPEEPDATAEVTRLIGRYPQS
jgi:ribonuclease E